MYIQNFNTVPNFTVNTKYNKTKQNNIVAGNKLQYRNKLCNYKFINEQYLLVRIWTIVAGVGIMVVTAHDRNTHKCNRWYTTD